MNKAGLLKQVAFAPVSHDARAKLIEATAVGAEELNRGIAAIAAIVEYRLGQELQHLTDTPTKSDRSVVAMAIRVVFKNERENDDSKSGGDALIDSMQATALERLNQLL